VPTLTQGDRIQDRSLAVIGGKGLFIKELEVAMEEMRADIAVHSMKDVPAEMPPGFHIAAVLKRADPFDALVAKPGITGLDDLPRGARLGTSSLRRQAQLYALRPDLCIETLRGNVDTRLKKLDRGEVDAILLACAGLVRLGLEARITARLDPQKCLPAVSQGIIGIECRSGDTATASLLAALEDAPTRIVMEAERAFSLALGGSCTSPIAAYAQLEGDQLTLQGLVAEPNGARVLRNSQQGSGAQAAAVGRQLAERLLAAGAGVLLERLRSA
jgi:hydroxymethylbilane synthase